MLRGLEIRDVLIIEHLELNFHAGLNVLTGETGAGKSILLDALGFVLGWRGRAELVRQGAKQGEVTAWFDLSEAHPARAILEEAGFPASDELLLRRVNSLDGRKTAWINDRRASGEILRAVSETLVELHGQHDDRGLLDTKGHRLLLDAFGGLEPQVEKLRARWRTWGAARKELEAHRAAAAALAEEEEFLRHAVGELDALNPEPGEDAALDARRRLMQAAERIREDVVRANAALAQEGAEGLLSDAARWLEGAAEKAEGSLDQALDALSKARSELSDAQQEVERALGELSHDPHQLELVEERLFAIRGLARKHQVAPDDLGGFADALREKLDALDNSAGDLAKLVEDEAAAADAYDQAAQKLTAARTKAAKALDAAMAKELAPLKMERAVFTTQVSDGAEGATGRDEVAFRVATNPGAPSGPLNKIASGGELSRFLLALKVCLTKSASGVTMIFDEIDRGVGGATADAVGRRLASLAGEGQVLVVTHSPQVAALGNHHLRVEKQVDGQLTRSTVVALSQDARVDELARMLSGDRVTDEARGAARALLNT